MTLRLKHERGWFAAGVEVENALTTLSDGAFKLYVHLCLHAPRHSGVIETSQTELARSLKKGNFTIRKYLKEMEQVGICRTAGFVAVPYSRGRIEITDAYWPYHRQDTFPENPTLNESVEEIRRLLQERACVHASFSTADEILARKWLEQGVTMERIEQAVLLGCTRKYVAWRNNQGSTPIASLRYFEPLLNEIDRLEIASDYWVYVRSRMRRLEALWLKSRKERMRDSEEDTLSGEICGPTNLVDNRLSSAPEIERR